jgi:hypothetical protein
VGKMKNQNNKVKEGYIYILTNPSFDEYIKIGYSEDVEERVKQLNRTECTPFAFRIYATYKVSGAVKDIELHKIIDSLAPSLRSVDEIDGKIRKREFYAMTPEEAYSLLQSIAIINGLTNNLTLYEMSKEEKDDEKTAKKITKLSKNRHHFIDCEFYCSLTNKNYKGTTSNDGTLAIIDVLTGLEVPNNNKPSKKAILGQALKDIGESVKSDETTYQRYHRLSRALKNQKL